MVLVLSDISYGISNMPFTSNCGLRWPQHFSLPPRAQSWQHFSSQHIPLNCQPAAALGNNCRRFQSIVFFLLKYVQRESSDLKSRKHSFPHMKSEIELGFLFWFILNTAECWLKHWCSSLTWVEGLMEGEVTWLICSCYFSCCFQPPQQIHRDKNLLTEVSTPDRPHIQKTCMPLYDDITVLMSSFSDFLTLKENRRTSNPQIIAVQK